jgi:predicted ATPase
MITRIKIEGYKSIKNQEVELGPINILIGGNGVGKSNFISIFSLIRNIYEKNLAGYILSKGGADSFLYFGKKTTQNINFEFTFGESVDKEKNKFLVLLEEAQDALFIKSIGTAFYSDYNNFWHQTTYEQNVRESNFSSINSGQAFWVNDLLKAFDVYHFHDTGDKSPMKGKSNIDDNRILKKDGSNIASFLYYLKEKYSKHFYRIEKTIQSVAPFFDKFILEPSKQNENQIQLEWREKGFIDTYFNAYHLSDGTLRFICLVTLLLQPNPPKTIIIDEPELGLHPFAINKLAGLIRKVSNEVQLIISTQSTNLLDNFEPKDIIVSDRKVNETVFTRLEDNEQLASWLQEYTLGDVWGKNIIGGQPF